MPTPFQAFRLSLNEILYVLMSLYSGSFSLSRRNLPLRSKVRV